jgi:hypothetical protein
LLLSFFYQKFGEVLNYFTHTHSDWYINICTPARNLQNLFRNSYISATSFLHEAVFFVPQAAGTHPKSLEHPLQVAGAHQESLEHLLPAAGTFPEPLEHLLHLAGALPKRLNSSCTLQGHFPKHLTSSCTLQEQISNQFIPKYQYLWKI